MLPKHQEVALEGYCNGLKSKLRKVATEDAHLHARGIHPMRPLLTPTISSSTVVESPSTNLRHDRDQGLDTLKTLTSRLEDSGILLATCYSLLLAMKTRCCMHLLQNCLQAI